ncbi:MAG: hypothetical protein F6K30_26075 [Cyanothece sp. SIO2G6]|nr:hypothetical protein [Cyanothece sp. SIO2G6]
MKLPSPPPQVQPVQRFSFTKPNQVIRAYTCVNLNPRYAGEPPISSSTGEFAGYIQMQIELLNGANYNDPGCYTGPVAHQGCHLFSNRQMGTGPTAMMACLAGSSVF